MRPIISRVKNVLEGQNATLGGPSASDRDFVHAVFGNFGYMLAFVIVLRARLRARSVTTVRCDCASTVRRSATRSTT